MNETTRLLLAGRGSGLTQGPINPPLHRASTILYPHMDDFNRRHEDPYRNIVYGTVGTQTTFDLAEAANLVENGAGSVIVSSGLAAVTLALTALLAAGDHVLVPDSVYYPTRAYCRNVLKRYGVETTFYDPAAGAAIEELIRDNTRIIYTESPGSLTFEMQDIPAIAQAAHRHGALVLMDNTWSAGVYFKPFDHGVDVSIQASTKYQAGHSDLVIGWITARDEALYRRIRDFTILVGEAPGPEDCWLTLRGLRSMHVRLAAHQAAGLEVARWLQSRPEIKRVLHPALPEDPGHALWKRDFTGCSSLFGIIFHETDPKRLNAFIDALELFKLGASWGGYQSLVIPAEPAKYRTAPPWTEPGYLLRLHVGLENTTDLTQDLAQAFEHLS